MENTNLKKKFNLSKYFFNDNFTQIEILTYFFVTLIFLGIIYYHHSSDILFYHPDYNTIYANIYEYLKSSEWNTTNFSSYSYQLLPQKITAYTIKVLNFLFGDFENFYSKNWIGFVFRLYLLMSAIGTIFFTNKIYNIFFEKNLAVNFLFLTTYIFYFCFTEIRNDGFQVFFTIIITYQCLLFYKDSSYRNLVILSILFSCSMLTRLSAISFVLPFFILAIICILEKKINVKRFLIYLLIFIFLSIIFYLIINDRNLDFYIKYFQYSPQFNNFGEKLFFQSQSGTKQLSIFWYIDYWFTSGFGVIVSTMTLIGVFNFLENKAIPLNLKIFLISVPITIIAMISFTKVATDRYSFALIPFFILFSAISLSSLKKKNSILSKIIYRLILIFLFLKLLVWIFTFFQSSTREKTVDWIYENIPKGSGIFLFNMYGWESVMPKLKSDYTVWQDYSIHPGYNINEISKLDKIGIQYYVHGENGFGYWFPEVQPHIINNKYENAQVLEKIFTNLYADFIKKTKTVASFHNKIYESGLFHSKGYDTSNYLKDVLQPTIIISKFNKDYQDNSYFILDSEIISSISDYKIKKYNNNNYITLNKKEDGKFIYKGPYLDIPKGDYNLILDIIEYDYKNEIEIILNGEIMGKQKLFAQNNKIKNSETININFTNNSSGSNIFYLEIISPVKNIGIKQIKIRKNNYN